MLREFNTIEQPITPKDAINIVRTVRSDLKNYYKPLKQNFQYQTNVQTDINRLTRAILILEEAIKKIPNNVQAKETIFNNKHGQAQNGKESESGDKYYAEANDCPGQEKKG